MTEWENLRHKHVSFYNMPIKAVLDLTIGCLHANPNHTPFRHKFNPKYEIKTTKLETFPRQQLAWIIAVPAEEVEFDDVSFGKTGYFQWN